MFRYFTLIAFFTVFSSWSQQRALEELFENFEFRKYIELSTQSSDSKVDFLKLAQSYYYIGDFQHAVEEFSKVDLNDDKIDPINLLYFAEALKNSKRYDEGLKQVNAYLTEFPKDKNALYLKKSIEFSKNNKGYATDESIQIEQVTAINNAAAQYQPMLWNNELYFIGEKTNSVLKQAKVDFSKDVTGLAYGFEVRPQTAFFKSGENSAIIYESPKFNVLGACRDEINEGWILTLTERKKSWSNLEAENTRLYFWNGQKEQKIKLKGIKSHMSVGQATLNSKGDFMVFVIDNGTNKGDLYFAEKKNEKWSKPQSLGIEINTNREEMSPAIVGDSLLFFSSNGRDGIGGHDIFKVTLKENRIQGKPEMLSFPVNSFSDDYGYCPKSIDEVYFVSERLESMGDADIFKVQKRIPWRLMVKVNIPNSNIKSGGKAECFANGESIKIDKKSDRDYLVEAIPSGSLVKFMIRVMDTTITKTMNLPSGRGRDTLLTIDLPSVKERIQEKISDIVEKGFVKEIERQKADLKSVYFAFDKFNVSTAEQEKLKLLIQELKAQPNAIVVVKTFADNRGDALYNLELTAKRAKEIYNYLIKNGVDKKRIRLQALGIAEYEENCSGNCDDAIHSKYRKAEFEIR